MLCVTMCKNKRILYFLLCMYVVKSSASCDDGYIDCGPLLANRRPPEARPSTTRRESAPLLTKSNSACVQNSDEDLADVVPPTMYRCLSRSCSIGSQLSAAASSTIHEESFNDLTLEAASSHGEYLPMSRLTGRKDDDPVPVSSIAQSAKRSGSKKSPPMTGPFPRNSVAAGAESVNLSSLRTPQSTAIASASYRNARDEEGYLLFHPTVGTSSADDRNFEGSLERLGPPPEVPTTTSADYIIPMLPPKQNTRANSMLSNSRPRIVDRRRGSSDNWGTVSGTMGPAVPSRENRDLTLSSISTGSAGISARPASERRASRKPNLTVDAVASANTAYSGELLIESLSFINPSLVLCYCNIVFSLHSLKVEVKLKTNLYSAIKSEDSEVVVRRLTVGLVG